MEEDLRKLERYTIEERAFDKRVTQYASGAIKELPAKPPRPRMRRRIVGDITTEALSDILKDNPPGVLCSRDELSGWFGSFDSYRDGSKGKDRAEYLEAYQGGPRTIDRVKRGAIAVPNWGMSLFGGIQPGPMRRLAGRITDDGLVQRFIVVFARPPGVGEDRAPVREILDSYRTMIRTLAEWAPEQHGKPTIVHLAPEAQPERRAVEEMARRVAMLPGVSLAFRAHLAKWGALFARLALTFHMAELVGRDGDSPGTSPFTVGAVEPISADTAARVARFMAEYMLPHAARFYSEILGQEHLTHARWIAGYVLAHGAGKLTGHSIGRAYRELRGNHAAIRDAMDILCAAGWTRPVDTDRGRPAAKWEVDPRVHELFAPRAAAEREHRESTRRAIADAAKALGLGAEAEAA
jgi:hypothetical protein